MRRNTLLEISGRVMHTFARATLNVADDKHNWQELSADFMNSDGRERVERLQDYGFTSMPHPRDSTKEAKSTEATGQAKKGPAAEAVAVFLGGQRNHPVIIGVDDRRHRPWGLKAGENAQYDDIGQMSLIRRIGTFILSLDSKDENGNDVQRMASLRHVEKQKQPRPQPKQQNDDDFKHEGETVNTEIRCTKGRIEFRVGDAVVGYYDKASSEWMFKSGDNFVKINGSAITTKHGTRVETVGKTYLGLDSAGESAPKVGTEDGLAKQTYGKV